MKSPTLYLTAEKKTLMPLAHNHDEGSEQLRTVYHTVLNGLYIATYLE